MGPTVFFIKFLFSKFYSIKNIHLNAILYFEYQVNLYDKCFQRKRILPFMFIHVRIMNISKTIAED